MPPTIYPPEDDTDYKNASRGLLATLDPCVVTADKDPDTLIWDNDSFNFIQKECPTDVANPSLWRQSQLCQKQGLFEVVPGIYQVRGLDLSNITFIQVPNSDGVVVIDPLTSVECARMALEMYQNKFPGNMNIKAMIYTHCHADHYGGASAITAAAGEDLPIYGPEGFLEHAVSENVYAGNAMGRRAVYMYGEPLTRSSEGGIGCGLGMAVSTGAPGLIAPTTNISETGHIVRVDDLEIQFQLTPGTEAPAEMNMYFPNYKALCMAENATHTLHNIQTLRGALVRDARLWARYMDESIVMYGKVSDVAFSSHHWPTWENDAINAFLVKQRDMYAYLHNETVRLLNDGKTGLEIAEDFALPPSIEMNWGSRGYYGSVSHNVKAIYNRYMGWYDGNPAHLWEHPPMASAIRYVKCMGGIDNVIALGKEYNKAGDLRFAATLLSHAVFAEQTNIAARQELQSVFTKLGYGAENATWRNIYLSGAYELDSSNTKRPSQMATTSETLMALELEQLFDTVAIRVEGPKAWDITLIIDFMVTDMDQGWQLNLSNGAITGHEIDFQLPANPPSSVTLTIWLTHKDLTALLSDERKDLQGLTTSGDVEAWNTLMSLLTTPDPAFAIVTPRSLAGSET